MGVVRAKNQPLAACARIIAHMFSLWRIDK